MTGLLLISTSLIALLGATLLVLARLEPQHRHIGEWGWSHIALAAALALGVALLPAEDETLRYAVQATAATTLVIASLALQLAGAAHYARRPWRWQRLLPLFGLLLLLILGLALVQQRLGVIAGALILTGGAWLAGVWLWRLRETGERFVAGCFFASGVVHLSGPLLDPLARSLLTHVLGTYVQGILAMALILLSVRRAHRETLRVGERLRQLYEQSMQGLLVIREHRVLYANPAALALFGYDSVEAFGPAEALMQPEDFATARERYRRIMRDRAGHISWEGERFHRDGHALYLRGSSSYIEWEGGPALLVLLIDDTERQRATQALRRQALHDELTDLPNRHAAVARLAELTAPGHPGFALLSADLDRFQLVNESLGHEVGDALLQAVARRLR